MRFPFLRFMALAAVTVASAAGRAEHCPAMEGAVDTLGTIDAGTRLRFLEASLDDEARRAGIWMATWASAYSGLVVLNATLLAHAADRDARIDRGVPTAASAFGLIALVAMPPRVLLDRRRIASALRGQSPCAAVRNLEAILLRDAASEAFARSPLVHAGNFVFNLGLGVVLAAGFGHAAQAGAVSALGIAVGELQVFTLPTRVVALLARYRAARLEGSAARIPPVVVPLVGPGQAGLQLSGAF